MIALLRARLSTVGQVRIEQVQMLYANGRFPLLVTLLAGIIVVGTLFSQNAVAPFKAALWLGAMLLQTLVRLELQSRFIRRQITEEDAWLWARRNALGALIAGSIWGFGIVWLMPAGRFDLQMLMILTTTAVAYAALAAMGSFLPSFTFIVLSAIVPSIIWACFQGDALHYVYAGLALIWLPAVLILARRYNHSLVRAIRLQHQYAEQRAIAEQASLSKSRFLASASHDLRQPIHALGMFLGALRGHQLPDSTQSVLAHMDAALGALDSLFVSLLDISKLDAGATEFHPAPLALQPLIASVCRQMAIEASAKELALVQVPTSLCAVSDPVVLGRIVRNLVANAVAYTDSGTVLVGCRRSGAEVRIEVWDSGRGIAPDQREVIFEEFYQVANPDRDRNRGLGLGLAIVRRLAALSGHKVDLTSEPGRGSVFRVHLPHAAGAMPEQLAVEARIELPRASGLILAIDDEVAVREAMRELLGSWGYTVQVAGSGAEAMAELERLPQRPDLIICDLRLRDGEDGIAVVHQLFEKIGAVIPALLLTGDTAPERIIHARASGLALLHKPLAHARLRTAIGNLVASGRASAAIPE